MREKKEGRLQHGISSEIEKNDSRCIFAVQQILLCVLGPLRMELAFITGLQRKNYDVNKMKSLFKIVVLFYMNRFYEQNMLSIQGIRIFIFFADG